MLMRALKIFVIALTLLAGVVLGVFALEPTLDLSQYREFIARQLSTRVGREVSLAGDLELTLGRRVTVRTGEVEVSNPEWSVSPRLFHTGALEVTLDLLGLASGVVHVEQLRLREVVLAAEQSADGKVSWALSSDETAPQPGGQGAAQSRWVFEEIDIDGLTLTYRDANRAAPLVMALQGLQQRHDGNMLLLQATGEINRSALRIDARLGTLSALLAGRDIEFTLDATLGEAELALAGRLGNPAALEGIELRSSIRSPSLTALAMLFDTEQAMPGNVDLALEIRDRKRGFGWAASGNLGEHQVNVSGSIARPQAIDGLQTKFDISGPNLAALGELIGIDQLPAEPYRLTGSVERDAPRLEFEHVQLKSGRSSVTLHGLLPQFPRVDDGNLRFDLEVQDASAFAGLFEAYPRISGPLSVKGALQARADGEGVIDATADWQGNRLVLKGPLGRHPDYRGSRLRFELSGPDAAALLEPTGTDIALHEAFQLSGILDVAEDGLLDVTLDASRIGAVEIEAAGSLGRLPDLGDLQVSFTLSGASLHAALGGLLEQPLPDKRFSLTGSLAGPIDAPYLSHVDARAGEARLQAQGRIGLVPVLAATDATFELDVSELPIWLPAYREAAWASQRYRATGRLRRAGRPLQLQGVTVTGGAVTWQLEVSIDESLGLVGSTLHAKALGPDLRPLIPAFDGYRPPRIPYQLDLQAIGRADHLEVSSLRGKLADVSFDGKGRLMLSGTGSGSVLELDVKVPRLSGIGSFDGLVLPDQPMRLTGRIQRSAAGYQVPDLRVGIAGGSLQGELRMAVARRPRVDVDLDLEGIDFAPFLPLFGSDSGDAPTTGTQDARLIPESALPLTALRAVDGSLRLHGEALRYPDPVFPGKLLVRDLDIAATLDNGYLVVEKARIDGDHGDMTVEGALNAGANPAVTAWVVQAEAFRFGVLAGGAGLEAVPTNEIRFQVEASGNTLRKLAGTAKGSIRVVGGSGVTTNTGLDRTLNAFSYELLRTLNPSTAREPNTHIDCGAMAAVINNGILELAPGVAIRTSHADIGANGTVNLSTEAIDIQFSSRARRGIGLSAAGVVRPFVAVRGTLGRPRLSLDAPGAIVAGTAAVATGGISVLVTTLLDRASTASNPCDALIAAADESRALRTINPFDAVSNTLRRR